MKSRRRLSRHHTKKRRGGKKQSLKNKKMTSLKRQYGQFESADFKNNDDIFKGINPSLYTSFSYDDFFGNNSQLIF